MHGLSLIPPPYLLTYARIFPGHWGQGETAKKLSYRKVTSKLREGPFQLALKVKFLERGVC